MTLGPNAAVAAVLLWNAATFVVAAIIIIVMAAKIRRLKARISAAAVHLGYIEDHDNDLNVREVSPTGDDYNDIYIDAQTALAILESTKAR